MAHYNRGRDWNQEDRRSPQDFDNDRRRFRQDQGWRGSDQTTLGSLGVSDYDSEFRSGRGSFYDRDTGYDRENRSASDDDYTRNWFNNLVNWNSTPIEERGEHYGRGPVGYKRSDDLIREDANDHLTQHSYIDATHISVRVEDGEVTLEGTVPDRDQKHYAEEVVEKIHGVNNVINHLRVRKSSDELLENTTGKQ